MTEMNGARTPGRSPGPRPHPGNPERPIGAVRVEDANPGTVRVGISGPIIIVDSSDIREGRLEDVRRGMSELVEFAGANEPRMIAYSVYLNEDATRVTVLQVHPDSVSAEFHMRVAGSAFAEFAALIRLSGIDVYGSPSPELLERLRRKAGMLGGGAVAVHGLHAGFARFGTSGPDDPG
jgi:hypothetical protein